MPPELTPIIQLYVSGLREGARNALDSQRHMDNMVTWAIAIAAAGIAGVVNLNLALHSCAPSSDILLGGLPLFVIIVLGVAARLSVYELIDADRLYAFAKANVMESLQFERDPETLITQALNVMKDQDDEKQLAPLRAKVNSWQSRASKLYWWTYCWVGLGAFWILCLLSYRLWQC